MLAVRSLTTLIFLVFSASSCRSGGAGSSTQGSGPSPTPAPPAEITLPGIDTSALTTRERKEWSGYVGEFLAPCADVPVPIAQCVLERRPCAKCMPAAKFILRGVRDGMSRDQIEKSFHGRFDADRVKDVAIDGSPSRGAESAPVVIVEFADFECPFCGVVAPQIDKLAEENPANIRFVFKFMPLPGHPHGEISARAAIAAATMGKFWEMHHKLFANQQHLEQSDLERYAKEVGLDVPKFRAEMNSKATTERIERDRKVADGLKIQGTPAVYINGREFDLHQDLKEWVALEIGSAQAAPAAAPTPAASAKSGHP